MPRVISYDEWIEDNPEFEDSHCKDCKGLGRVEVLCECDCGKHSHEREVACTGCDGSGNSGRAAYRAAARRDRERWDKFIAWEVGA
jgi:hypothetical protein